MPAASRATSSSACTAWARCSTSPARRITGSACRVYAPVGGHAISSPIWCAVLETAPTRLRVGGRRSERADRAILERPQSRIGDARRRDIRKIPLPRDLYARSDSIPPASNSATGRRSTRCSPRSRRHGHSVEAAPLVDGTARRRHRALGAFAHRRQGPSAVVGEADDATVAAAMAARAAGGLCRLDGDAVRSRGGARTRRAISSKRDRGRLIALLQAEGGKTLDDARRGSARGGRFLPLLCGARRGARCARRRCRARPARATSCAIAAAACSSASARGIFRWRSSSARSAAALAAGNAVVAKPAEQTPLVAAEAVRMLHQAGVPASALHLVPGDGKVGAALVADPRVAGVAFTGSTEVGARDQSRAGGARTGRSCR